MSSFLLFASFEARLPFAGRTGRRPPSVQRFCGAALLLLLWVAGGCATGPSAWVDMGRPVSLTPRGPGHVLATPDAAALDALAYCHLAAHRQVTSNRVARGGAVYPVAGGFSYAEPARADATFAQLRYRLRPADVLHFRHYSSRAWLAKGPGAFRLPERDRTVVDLSDPLHRPVYFMSPDRHVRVYLGKEKGEHALARVLFGTGVRDDVVWLSRVDPALGTEPFALQPTPPSR